MLRVRVAGLARRNGNVLLARHVKHGRTAYLLPGGGVNELEPSRDALVREVGEEASVACEVGELRYVVETRGPTRHLVQFVYEIELLGEIGASRDARVVECAWHPAEALRSLPIRPDFGAQLADDLENGRSGLRYIIAPWRDD